MRVFWVSAALGVALLLGRPAQAAPADKPDCSAQQKAYDDQKAAEKVVKAEKADLTSCKEMKGKEKKDCEKPIKDKLAADKKDAKTKIADAKKAVDCCKNPKKKGCTPAAATP